MKKILRLTALLLCICLLASIFAGCSFPNSYNGGDTEEESSTQAEFNPPYLENYYVNKHEPVCVEGRMEVYKYDEEAPDL